MQNNLSPCSSRDKGDLLTEVHYSSVHGVTGVLDLSGSTDGERERERERERGVLYVYVIMVSLSLSHSIIEVNSPSHHGITGELDLSKRTGGGGGPTGREREKPTPQVKTCSFYKPMKHLNH